MNFVLSAMAPDTIVAAVAQNKHKRRPVGLAEIRKRVQSPADKFSIAAQKVVTEQIKRHGSDTEIHQVLHRDISDVLCSRKSCLYHGESTLHKKD